MITDYIFDYIFQFLKTQVNKMHLIKSLQDTKHLEDYTIFLYDALRYFNFQNDEEVESVLYPTENKDWIPRIKIPFEDLAKINFDFIKEYNQKLMFFIRDINKRIESTFEDIEANDLSSLTKNGKYYKVLSERSEVCVQIILLLDSLSGFYRFIYSGVLIPQEKEKNLDQISKKYFPCVNKEKLEFLQTELKHIESQSKRYPSWKAVCEITVVCLFGYAVTQGVISVIQWLWNCF